MADFSHLLDEVDEALHQEEENEHDNEEASTTLNDLQQQQPSQEEEEEGEEWDRGDREQLDVPAALEELAQRRLLDPSLAGGDYGEDGDKDDDSAIEAQELMDGTDTANGNSNGNEATNAYRTLKKGWQQEVACPELLPFDEDTVNTISQELGRRDDIIAQLSEQAGTDVEALMESVMKVDMARAKFVLTDLCRTRISKIQEHPVHMRDLVGRMSDHEIDFLKGYGQLVEHHFRRTVLDHVGKDALKNLDEPDMIDQPNLDQYVFVKVKEDSEIQGGTDEEPTHDQHAAGTTLIARYNVVRELYSQGKVELFL